MFFSALLSILISPFSAPEFEPIEPVAWHEASIFQVNTDLDPQVQQIVDRYLKNIRRKGFITSQQGVWIGTKWAVLADQRGEIHQHLDRKTRVEVCIVQNRLKSDRQQSDILGNQK